MRLVSIAAVGLALMFLGARCQGHHQDTQAGIAGAAYIIDLPPQTLQADFYEIMRLAEQATICPQACTRADQTSLEKICRRMAQPDIRALWKKAAIDLIAGIKEEPYLTGLQNKLEKLNAVINYTGLTCLVPGVTVRKQDKKLVSQCETARWAITDILPAIAEWHNELKEDVRMLDAQRQEGQRKPVLSSDRVKVHAHRLKQLNDIAPLLSTPLAFGVLSYRQTYQQMQDILQGKTPQRLLL